MLVFRAIVCDVRRSLVENRAITIALCAYLLFEVGRLLIMASDDGCLGRGSAGFSQLDVLVFLNRGVKEFEPHSNTLFLLDFGWMIPQLLIGLSVCLRSARDFGTYSVQTITRIKSRALWFAEKAVWAFVLVTGFSVAMVVLSWMATVAFGDACAIGPSPGGFAISGVDVRQAESCAVWGAFGLGYVATLASALLLTTVSLVAGPIWSYFISVAYLIAASFFSSYLLFFEFVMIMRNDIAISSGFNTLTGLVICFSVMVVSVVGGLLISRKVEYI